MKYDEHGILGVYETLKENDIILIGDEFFSKDYGWAKIVSPRDDFVIGSTPEYHRGYKYIRLTYK